MGVPMDIKNRGSLKASISQLRDHAAFGTINIIVNNAAGPITSTERQILWPDELWSSAIDVKTIGALRVLREFLPFMAQDGTGRVINVAGSSGVAVWSPAVLHGVN